MANNYDSLKSSLAIALGFGITLGIGHVGQLVGIPSYAHRQFTQQSGSISTSPATSLLITQPDMRQRSEEDRAYTIDDYVNAIIQIESGGNPNTIVNEPDGKISYGLGCIKLETALEIESRFGTRFSLPSLGQTRNVQIQNLLDPQTNIEYCRAYFSHLVSMYDGDPFVAVSAYNAGEFAPLNARAQERFNSLLNISLATDGNVGSLTSAATTRFQRWYNAQQFSSEQLEVDGKLGPLTRAASSHAWRVMYPNASDPQFIIPSTTHNHVDKFTTALLSEDRTDYISQFTHPSESVQSVSTVRAVPEEISVPNNYCSRYVRLAAEALFDLHYPADDAWNLRDHSAVREYRFDDNDSLTEFVQRGMLRPGDALGVYNPTSRYNSDRRTHEAGYTHVILYLGQEGQTLYFADQFGSLERNKISWDEMVRQNRLQPIEVLYLGPERNN